MLQELLTQELLFNKIETNKKHFIKIRGVFL